MKKIFVALSMVAFLAACDDSASAGNNEPTTLSGAEGQGRSSSSSVTSAGSVTLSSSSLLLSDEGVLSRSSSSEMKTESSSSEKLSEISSCSEDDDEYSSSSVILATPCKTETEDNCEYGTLLDDRDGQTYKTVKIGNQWWMADNLNYETENSYCYDDDPSNCSKYGRLYTWAAAKTVCPEGWHLPDTTEWNTLFTAVGGSSTAGAKLKSQTGWTAYYGITNEDSFGFSALPAGFRFDYGHYINEGDYAYFWSSTEYSSYGAYYVSLDYNGDYAYLGNDGKSNGFSVRCVKD